jgi:hypothetical protein
VSVNKGAVLAVVRVSGGTIMLQSNDTENVTTDFFFMYRLSLHVNKRPSRAIDLADFTAAVM